MRERFSSNASILPRDQPMGDAHRPTGGHRSPLATVTDKASVPTRISAATCRSPSWHLPLPIRQCGEATPTTFRINIHLPPRDPEESHTPRCFSPCLALFSFKDPKLCSSFSRPWFARRSLAVCSPEGEAALPWVPGGSVGATWWFIWCWLDSLGCEV